VKIGPTLKKFVGLLARKYARNRELRILGPFSHRPEIFLALRAML
jgi:hypothetical protein